MRFYSNSITYDCPWTCITSANWQKYPSRWSPHVVSVDIINREVDSETGILKTERLIAVEQEPPGLLKRVRYICIYVVYIFFPSSFPRPFFFYFCLPLTFLKSNIWITLKFFCVFVILRRLCFDIASLIFLI